MFSQRVDFLPLRPHQPIATQILQFAPPCPTHGTTLGLLNSRYESPEQPGRKNTGPPFSSGPAVTLVLLFASFLAAALARQRFFHAFLFARLEVKGVTLDFLNNVLLLNFPLKAAQGVL